MRKLLLTSAALLTLAVASPAMAAGGAAVGGTVGATTGATAGFFLGGPVGAAIGGAIGAGVGATTGASVDADAIDYARHHRIASITFEGDLRPGYRVGHGVKLYAVPTDDRYSYVYVNGAPVLIDNATQTVVWVGS
ncbi:MAG TPA: DUF1236 domain-containing protein [Devosia sp.]|jgi:hypothetical protein|nr:DUF1236 domain-containing protein [Devosia sp.]